MPLFLVHVVVGHQGRDLFLELRRVKLVALELVVERHPTRRPSSPLRYFGKVAFTQSMTLWK